MTIYLSKYTTFDSLEELNEAIGSHLSRCQNQLSETDRDAIMYIGRMACKYYGAMTNKNENFAKAIGKSVTQARRIIRKLEQLGIIKRVAMIRPVMKGYGANVIQVLPVCEATNEQSGMDTRPIPAEPTPARHAVPFVKKHSFSFSLSTNSLQDTYSKPYITFIKRVESLLGTGHKKLVSRLYGVYLAHTKALKLAYDEDELLHIGLQALQITLQAHKRKTIGNLAGYYNGTIDQLFDKLHRKEMESFYAN